MPEFTPNLGLGKPLPGEIVDDGRVQYNQNFDRIDQSPGVEIVSSWPSNPYLGQVVYHRGQDNLRVWNGEAWTYVATPTWHTGSNVGTPLRGVSTTLARGFYEVPGRATIDLSLTNVPIEENGSPDHFYQLHERFRPATFVPFFGYASGNVALTGLITGSGLMNIRWNSRNLAIARLAVYIHASYLTV